MLLKLEDGLRNINIFFTHRYRLGTIRDVTSNIGAIQNHITYNKFGRFITQTNPNVRSRFNYTGREFDGEAGLYYYRSRYYDPVGGRFIGEDAIGFLAGDPNLYRYVGNSPVNAIDPFGLIIYELGDGGTLEIECYTDFFNPKVTFARITLSSRPDQIKAIDVIVQFSNSPEIRIPRDFQPTYTYSFTVDSPKLDPSWVQVWGYVNGTENAKRLVMSKRLLFEVAPRADCVEYFPRMRRLPKNPRRAGCIDDKLTALG
jgi:RHS repeat-associated protein